MPARACLVLVSLLSCACVATQHESWRAETALAVAPSDRPVAGWRTWTVGAGTNTVLVLATERREAFRAGYAASELVVELPGEPVLRRRYDAARLRVYHALGGTPPRWLSLTAAGAVRVRALRGDELAVDLDLVFTDPVYRAAGETNLRVRCQRTALCRRTAIPR